MESVLGVIGARLGLPRAGAGARGRSTRSGGARGAIGARAVVAPRGLGTLLRHAGWRRRALLGLSLIGVCGALFLWFRSSSLVAVSEVRISGVRGPQAGAIEATLRAAARRQSTLAPSTSALRRALAGFPQVRSLSAAASFPHAMRISVREQLPVAVLQAADGSREAAAADGALLGPSLARGPLPLLHVSTLADAGAGAKPLDSYLSLLGGAPEALLPYVSSLEDSAKGLTVILRDGLTVYFGDSEAAREKWLSLARVLLATNIAQLRYVDVREPQRPAVGLVGATEAGAAGASGASSTAAGSSGAASPEQSALVATLQHALGAGPSASPEATSAGGGAGSAEAAGGEAAGAESAPAAGASAGGEPTPSAPASSPEGESPPGG